MPEYLAPGVYVEEVNTGPRPIEGVSTSTAGFVGETERGSTQPHAGHQLAGLPALASAATSTGRRSTRANQLPALRGPRLLRQRRAAAVRRPRRSATPPSRRRQPGRAPPVRRSSRPSGRATGATTIRLRLDPASAARLRRRGLDQPGHAVVPDPGRSTTATVSRTRSSIPPIRRSSPNPNRREPDAFEDFDNLSPVDQPTATSRRRSSTARRG